MTAPAITGLSTRLLTLPLHRPWGADAPENHVIVTEVHTEAGTGHGFSWTPTIGALAVQSLLDHDIRKFVVGKPAEPEMLWDLLWKHLHEAGGGGLTTIAMSGVDLALWDLKAHSGGSSLADYLGRRHPAAAVYGSGVNLHYSQEELVEQVQRWVGEGKQAVKIKVGKPDLAEDIDRVAAVRAVLGPHRKLMVDANQRWDLPAALRAVTALEPFGLEWLEEPLRADDLWGYAQLGRSTRVPIALGENLHNIYRFRDFIAAGAVDVVQPNIVRVGGITPFRRIVELARTHSIRVAPHLLPELSGQLALTLSEPVWVEDVEDAGFGQLGALTGPSPVRIRDGALTDSGAPGLGFAFVAALPAARTGSAAATAAG